ncbi:methionine synthase [mine drainage metagenome]|uniref:Methionine synthase n=1 Tax=mine drainage metagenome TaxID=410659 RepID=T1A564_9ZZZZ
MTDGEVGVGMLDVHQDRVETAREVEDRLLRAARILGDPSKVYANPDCGLRTRSLDVAWAKLGALVEGARRARKALS